MYNSKLVSVIWDYLFIFHLYNTDKNYFLVWFLEMDPYYFLRRKLLLMEPFILLDLMLLMVVLCMINLFYQLLV